MQVGRKQCRKWTEFLKPSGLVMRLMKRITREAALVLVLPKTGIWSKCRPASLDSLSTGWRDSHGPLEKLARNDSSHYSLLDQFPRNMFRGTAQAFRGGRSAGVVSTLLPTVSTKRTPHGSAHGLSTCRLNTVKASTPDPVKLFATLSDQLNNAATLNTPFATIMWSPRFGRFPHRNKILGRNNSKKQVSLKQPTGSSF